MIWILQKKFYSARICTNYAIEKQKCVRTTGEWLWKNNLVKLYKLWVYEPWMWRWIEPKRKTCFFNKSATPNEAVRLIARVKNKPWMKNNHLYDVNNLGYIICCVMKTIGFPLVYVMWNRIFAATRSQYVLFANFV